MRDYPREAYGLIVNVTGHERYRPCRIIAKPHGQFIIDPSDYAKAEALGDILAVVHSRPNSSANPSEAELAACKASGVPWHILAVPLALWETILPDGYQVPLLGRAFSPGVLDCYSLIRDWYRNERCIELPTFDPSWWLKDGNLQFDNIRAVGFEPVPLAKIEPGDIILMQIGASIVNHAAIYIGKDRILHHLMTRLSCREVYGPFWRKSTRVVIRYTGTPEDHDTGQGAGSKN
jgi:cell wall-associated NlpC family hydrolase